MGKNIAYMREVISVTTISMLGGQPLCKIAVTIKYVMT